MPEATLDQHSKNLKSKARTICTGRAVSTLKKEIQNWLADSYIRVMASSKGDKLYEDSNSASHNTKPDKM